MWLAVIGIVIILALIALILYGTSPNNERSVLTHSFPLNEFQASCQHHQVRIENYGGTLKADNESLTYVRLKEWFDDPASKLGQMSKLSFKPDSTNPIAQYILKWIASQASSFPHELQSRLETDPSLHYSIRFTGHKWSYPNHFDCLDNYAVVLAGERHCILDKTKEITLTTGEMLYIPSPQEHQFWCDTDPGQLNILLNINFAPRYQRGKCDAEFAKLYPFQIERLEDRIDYT